MRIVDFVYNMIDSFAPMEESDRTALRKDANLWYSSQRDKIMNDVTKELKDSKTPKDLKVSERLIFWGEQWYTRTIIAILFIILKPTIQDWYTASPDEDEDE